MNNEDYVSYELSKVLKACGFNEPTNSFYDEASVRQGEFEIVPTYAKFNEVCRTPGCECVSAPTLAHAQKWLREKWDWHIIVEPQIWDGLTYEFKLWHRFRGYENTNRGFHFSSYECALSAGISASLELIKKGEC